MKSISLKNLKNKKLKKALHYIIIITFKKIVNNAVLIFYK